jgi:Skp family chaperone for outer membrane proteins
MIRWSVLIAGAVTAAGAALVTGAVVPARTAWAPDEVKVDAAKPPVVIGQKTGYFNMAKVMRECKKAKTAVARLNARKDRMSANLIGLRNMHADLQALARSTTNVALKEQAGEDLIRLARQIEDADRALNKILNDRASIIIVELYDDLHAVATAVARDNGLVAVLAYPDATNAEEAESPLIKEMKLKPPALQPVYLDSSVDYTTEILRRLNEKFDENDE